MPYFASAFFVLFATGLSKGCAIISRTRAKHAKEMKKPGAVRRALFFQP